MLHTKHDSYIKCSERNLENGGAVLCLTTWSGDNG